MIYIMGDTHGDINRFCTNIDSKWTYQDKVIVCGDFGFIWEVEKDTKRYRRELEKLSILESKPYEILFVTGNHENFDRLKKFPTIQKYGGKVKQIRKNIFLLMRGQRFIIENHTFFTMGGAHSVDKDCRIEHVDWWQEELPSLVEYDTAIQTLAEYKEFDFVITHTAPQTIIRMMHFTPYKEDLELTGFLEWIFYEISFKYWFFGHFHADTKIKGVEKIIPVYSNIYRINNDKSIECLGEKEDDKIL